MRRSSTVRAGCLGLAADDLPPSSRRLAQVEVALGADPSNAELASLQSELKELIDLTKQAIALSASAAGPSKPKAAPAAARPPPPPPAAAAARATPEGSASPSAAARAAEAPSTAAAGLTTDASKYKVGDQVMAKYADGRFYPAKIVSQAGPAANPLYTVTFLEYASSPPSTVPLSSLRLMAEAQKRKAEKSADEREKEKKKAKSEKWKEIKDGKNQVQVAKQQGWQSFAKKATKKGLVGVKTESMFKTPDAVNSKGAACTRPLAIDHPGLLTPPSRSTYLQSASSARGAARPTMARARSTSSHPATPSRPLHMKSVANLSCPRCHALRPDPVGHHSSATAGLFWAPPHLGKGHPSGPASALVRTAPVPVDRFICLLLRSSTLPTAYAAVPPFRPPVNDMRLSTTLEERARLSHR